MTKLHYYMNDGACAQARAVLAYLQMRLGSGIESSWNKERGSYDGVPSVARWENCREQGYIVSLVHNKGLRQLNIAFFEHRNSDSICAVRWEQWSMNSITIETAKFPEGVYSNKSEVSHSEGFGEADKMAKWISKELENFWLTCEEQ